MASEHFRTASERDIADVLRVFWLVQCPQNLLEVRVSGGFEVGGVGDNTCVFFVGGPLCEQGPLHLLSGGGGETVVASGILVHTPLLPLGLPNSLAFVARAKLVPAVPSPSPITPHPQQAPVPCPALFRVPCSFCTGLRQAFQDVLDCRSVVACGVGLDFGEVVLAQCGSMGMTEYVVAGEVSARVMEVEALTREVGRTIVITEPVADRLSPKLRDTGIIPCAEGVDGVPCYGILGEEWELDIVTVKKNIYGFHDRRDAIAQAAAKAAEEAATPQKKNSARGGGRTSSVSSYAPDPNEVRCGHKTCAPPSGPLSACSVCCTTFFSGQDCFF